MTDSKLNINTGVEAVEEDEEGKEKILSSQDKYKNEWRELKLLLIDNTLKCLKNLAFNGELKVSKFRSICWSIFLKVISNNPNDWKEERTQQRLKYEMLKEEFSRNPHLDPNDDPLSQSKQSTWNQYFGDQELFSVIKQDVIRTFPGVEFFRKSFVQDAMINVLFYYAREHEEMVYRQGMHEILAPILFVVFYDQQFLIHFTENSGDIDSVLLDVLNPNYLEADSYVIFSRLMSSIESYYRITNIVPNSAGYFPERSSNENLSAFNEVEVINQLNQIRDHILAKEDEHLANHLVKLEIPLHIFGIRWLRLLFGREFPLLDLLMLWDAIFANSDHFDLPDYILVAMLVRIRDKLLLSDYTTCLTHLMKYPNNSDVALILKHALHLQMPKKFDRPSACFIYVISDKKNATKSNSSMQQAAKRQSTIKNNSPKSSIFIKEKVKKQSLSNGTEIKETDMKLKDLQYKYALNSARLEKVKASRMAGDNIIIDGYFEDSPEYLKLELQNAHTMISVSRLKLSKYLDIFHKYISRSNPEELNQAVNGIEELVTFLDIKCPITNLSQQKVDTAMEATNEISSFKEKTTDVISPYVFVDTEEGSSKRIENNQNHCESDLDTTGKFNIKDLRTSAINNSPPIRYEIPDNTFVQNSVLGNKMNVELKLFRRNEKEINDKNCSDT